LKSKKLTETNSTNFYISMHYEIILMTECRSISIYQVQTCKIKPNKVTVQQDNKVRKIH